MTESAHNYRGYDGQQLHAAPSEDSRVLTTVRERQLGHPKVHRIVPTKVQSGDWAQVDVIEYDGDFDTYEPERAKVTGGQWKGWLRFVNSRGQPAFWFYTRD